MTEQIERMARAMCKANGRDPDVTISVDKKAWTLYITSAEAARDAYYPEPVRKALEGEL
jgi:hypothetical protein